MGISGPGTHNTELSMQIQGKVAFITGGARGLGKEFAEVVLKNGGKVCIGDVRAALGRQTEHELNQKYGAGKVLFQYLDVTEHQQFEGVVKSAIEHFGYIDIFVNNAGIADEDQWLKMININLTAVIWGCKLAIKYMSRSNNGKGGVIINIASTAGLTAVGFEPSYAATKHGVVGYTRSIAANLRESGEDHGIRSCCLCPSFTATPLLQGVEGFLTNDNKATSDQSSNAISLIRNVGIIEPADVAKGFHELLVNEDNDGAVLTVTPKGLTYRHPRTLKPKL